MKKPLPKDFDLNEQDVDYCIAREKEIELFSNKLGLRIGCVCTVIVLVVVMATQFEISESENILVQIFSLFAGLFFSLFLYGFSAFLFSAIMIGIPVCKWYERKQVTPKLLAARNYFELKNKYEAWLRKTQEDYWLSLSGVGFEHALADIYRRNGYQVHLTSATGDRGVDLFIKNEYGKEAIVQCKAHQNPVGVGAVRDLFGALHDHDAEKAILASVSGFTKGVYEFINNKPIELLDLDKIIEMACEDGEKTSL